MSRTRILSKMDNNTSNNILSLLGFQAYSLNNGNNDNGFQQFINKSLENGKQNITNDISAMSDINGSLLNTLNMIDSTIKNDSFDVSLQNDDNTYTLDDLLDFDNENIDAANLFDRSLEDDSNFLQIPTDTVFLETAIASPLSSSSDESCDFDDILFLDESPAVPENSVMETEVIDEANRAVQNDHQYTVETPTTEQTSLLDFLSSNGTDLSSLCSLFQNYSVPEPVSPAASDEEQSVTLSAPSSPDSSESDSESVRYKPYTKPKTQEQKQRKKAQNRTAATRYRIKKKDELKAMVEEADELEKKNKDLKGKVDGLKSEIDYLKNLMLDVIKARLAKGASPQKLLSVVMAQ